MVSARLMQFLLDLFAGQTPLETTMVDPEQMVTCKKVSALGAGLAHQVQFNEYPGKSGGRYARETGKLRQATWCAADRCRFSNVLRLHPRLGCVAFGSHWNTGARHSGISFHFVFHGLDERFGGNRISRGVYNART